MATGAISTCLLGLPLQEGVIVSPSQARPRLLIATSKRQEDTYWAAGVCAEALAAKPCRPLEAKLVEQRLAAGTGLLADGPAGRPGSSLHTLRGVDGAQKGLELGGATGVNQRRKGVQLQTGIVLAVVAQGVGQQRLGVGLVLADGDRDGLAGWRRSCDGTQHGMACASLDQEAKRELMDK